MIATLRKGAARGLAALFVASATSSVGAAQTTIYACTADRLYQDTLDLGHRGWALDARGDWDTTPGTLPDVLAGSLKGWDDGDVPVGQTSCALYQNPPIGVGQDCFLPSGTVLGIGVDRFGFSVAWIGDLDEDGRDDFVVGAPRGGPGNERGRVYLFLSADFPSGGLPASAGGASLVIEGVGDGDRLGYSVSAAGHFIPESGTARLDLAIGAPGGLDAPGLAQPGSLYVLSGFDVLRARSAGGMSAVFSVTDPIFAKTVLRSGLHDWDRYGHAVALAGDVDVDGDDDIVVGAPQYYFDATAGAIQTTGRGFGHVILGGATHPGYLLRGEQDGSRFGNSVGGELNVDGSGDDVIVGAPFFDDLATNPNYFDAGKAYVWSFQQPVGYVRTHPGIAVDVPPVGWIGEESGWGFASIGDLGTDGVPEYTIGSWAYSDTAQPVVCSSSPAPCSGVDDAAGGDRAGRSRVFDGATGALLFQIVGQDRKDSAGVWASPIGDVDGNGIPDLVVSAFRWSPLPPNPVEREVGRIYLHLVR